MNYLDGKIWDVSVWSRPITDEEYLSLGVTPPQKGQGFAEWFCVNYHNRAKCGCGIIESGGADERR